MHIFSYERLSKIADKEPPIRGTQLYPVYDRRSMDRFAVVEEDGQKVFHVCHDSWWERDEITKEEAESGKYPQDEIGHTNWHGQGEQWWHHRKIPHHVLTVRPGNTAEIVVKTDYLCQGDRWFLARAGGGEIYGDSKRGGVIYRSNTIDNVAMFPLVKNMRLTCDYFPKPVGNYRLFGQHVSRKIAKDTLKKYDDFYATVEVMMKSMPMEVFADIAIDALKAKKVDVGRYWIRKEEKQQWLNELDTLIDESPLDAAAFYCALLDVDNFWNIIKNREDASWGQRTFSQSPHSLFASLHRHLKRHIYESSEDVLVETELEFGKVFPQTAWQYIVTLDGKPVQQYRS